jgi:SAM-dependent methyltransferase
MTSILDLEKKPMRKRRGEQTVYLRRGLSLPSLEDVEGQRLNIQHRLLASVAQRHIYFARQVKNPKAILDVASGTGIWGYEMALHFKQATIDNLDINREMGEQWLRVFTSNRPDLRKRLRFVEADALRPLPYEGCAPAALSPGDD